MKISISDKVTGSADTVFITEMLDSNRGCENKNFFFSLSLRTLWLRALIFFFYIVGVYLIIPFN